FFNAPRIYHGTWGSALFPAATPDSASLWRSLPSMPEWWIIVVCLFMAAFAGVLWRPMLLAAPLFQLAIIIPIFQALMAGFAIRRQFGQRKRSWIKYWAVTSLLHLIQPIARLGGRIGRGLTPWRRRGVDGFSIPWRHKFTLWSEQWQAADTRLRGLEAMLQNRGAVVRRGGDFDRWDLELRAGMLGAVRMDLVGEEHGQCTQLVRFRAWPRCTGIGGTLIGWLLLVALVDAKVASWQGGMICLVPAALLVLRSLQECAAGM